MIILGLVVVFLLVIILLLLIGWLTITCITCLPNILKDCDEAIGKLKERKERRNKIKK